MSVRVIAECPQNVKERFKSDFFSLRDGEGYETALDIKEDDENSAVWIKLLTHKNIDKIDVVYLFVHVIEYKAKPEEENVPRGISEEVGVAIAFYGSMDGINKDAVKVDGTSIRIE